MLWIGDIDDDTRLLQASSLDKTIPNFKVFGR